MLFSNPFRVATLRLTMLRLTICCLVLVSAVAGAPAVSARTAATQTVDPVSDTKLLAYGRVITPAQKFGSSIHTLEERAPFFDGIPIRLSGTPDGRVFTKQPLDNAAFKTDAEDLAVGTEAATRYTDNFVQIGSTAEAGWDWTNNADWAAVASNVRNVARTSQRGGAVGIQFDPEVYSYPGAEFDPWYYPDQTQAASRSFADYQQTVRNRGRSFAKAILSEQPDAQFHTLFMLSAVSSDLLGAGVSSQAEADAVLATHRYGLLPAFVEGLLDVFPPHQAITDGNEFAYWYKSESHYAEAEAHVAAWKRFLLAPENRVGYRSAYRFGHAVYVDYDLALYPKALVGGSMPHYLSRTSRDQYLEQATYYALTYSDDYAWVYLERSSWFANLPYLERVTRAVTSAKEKYAADQPLGFDLSQEITEASSACSSAGGGTFFPC
jgi:hypothetical protein